MPAGRTSAATGANLAPHRGLAGGPPNGPFTRRAARSKLAAMTRLRLPADSPLRERNFRRLYGAQLLALGGTGLTTVALALLAADLAGQDAGAVLGTALTVKMVVYVLIGPLAGALSPLVDRRRLMVTLDVVRAATLATFPFIDQVWQIYLAVAVLQVASAGFTPTFQAVIPDILPDEERYTRALSLSRLAYDSEMLLSPSLAALMLLALPYDALFAANGLAFLASALLVMGALVPKAAAEAATGRVWERTLRGVRLFWHDRALRGLLALYLTASSAGAMVLVNTVVYVQALDGPGAMVGVAIALFGAGSILVALSLPWLMRVLPERTVFATGAVLASTALGLGLVWTGWAALLTLWFAIGLGMGLIQTPASRLVRRAGGPGDRPALFAAQFALSHAAWLIAYPTAGWMGAWFGLTGAFAALLGLAVIGAIAGFSVWRS